MPVVPGQAITSATLQTLAALANAKLLPIVNARIADNTWPGSQFDELNPVDENFIGGDIVNPQPIYEFPETILLPRPVIAAQADGFGYYLSGTPALAKVWPYKLAGGNKSFSTAFGALSFTPQTDNVSILWSWPAVAGADGYVIQLPDSLFGIGTPFIDAGAATSFKDSALNENVFNPMSWLHQLNRLRGDLWVLMFQAVTGGESLLFNEDNVLSGPWIAGTNDPAAYPLLQDYVIPYDGSALFHVPVSFEGELQGSLAVTRPPSNLFTCFKSVQFYCAAADAAGLSVSTGRRHVFAPSTGGTGAQDFTLNYNAQKGGLWTATLRWAFFGPAGAPPSPAAFNATATPGTGVVWSTYADTTPGNPAGSFIIEAALTLNPADGANGSIHFTLAPPATYSFVGNTVAGNPVTVESHLEFSNSAVPADATVIHPADTGKVFSAADMPDNSDFTLNGNYGAAAWWISNPAAPGCWSALTLPVPGQHVFIDQDIPPYIGARAPDENFAIAGNGLAGLNVPWASSMRQSAPIKLDGAVFVPADPKINPLVNGISSRPAQWPVRRDTDPEVLQWGDSFDPAKGFILLSSVLNGKNRTNPPLDFFVKSDSVLVKITAFKGGSVVQQNGMIFDGEAPSNPLTIKVWNNTNPVSDPPYVTGVNSVSLPPDAAVNPKGVIWAATAENPAASDGQLTAYDLLVEVASTARSYPLMIPNLFECFSYCLNGAVFLSPNNESAEDGRKPIPQNGYCIFKLKARRMPGADAAAELPVNIGQRINGVFETALTVTIPAHASVSDDQPVFWPVLGGQELRYQCADQIQLDVWTNFQPIFFSEYYGRYQPSGFVELTAFDPTAFNLAIAFSNLFNPGLANYPDSLAEQVTRAQFPLSSANYNDMESLLGLIQ